MKQLNLCRRMTYFSALVHLVSIYPITDYYINSPLKYHAEGYIFRYFAITEHYPFLFSVTSILLVFGIMKRTSARLLSIPIYLLVTNIENSMFQILDGGSNLVHLALFYFMLSNELSKSPFERFLSQTIRVVLIFQLSIMYFTTGVLKVIAPLWQEGVAIFYVLTSLEYSTPFIAKLIWNSSPLFFVIPNYAVMFYQVSFPISLFNKKVKNLYLSIGLIFHIFIATIIGLPTFALQVVCLYPVLLDDKSYLRLKMTSVAIVRKVKFALMNFSKERS